MVDDHEGVQLAVDAINKTTATSNNGTLTSKTDAKNTEQNTLNSVIQSSNNHQSVIQTAQVITKGNVILVSKPNSVIQTAQGGLSALQVVEASNSDENYSDDEQTKKRRDNLSRRPSFRKIFNDLSSGGEIAVVKGYVTTNGSPIMLKDGKLEYASECDTTFDSELSCQSPSKYATVIPASAIQIQTDGVHGIVTNNQTTSAIVQYATQGQDGQYYVPVCQAEPIPKHGEDQQRKREMRLLKNREAARECRRKKKEYIKCLENRVAVLENQNKTLIEELKTLKELYCCEVKTE